VTTKQVRRQVNLTTARWNRHWNRPFSFVFLSFFCTISHIVLYERSAADASRQFSLRRACDKWGGSIYLRATNIPAQFIFEIVLHIYPKTEH
jgi:hypothetical protein